MLLICASVNTFFPFLIFSLKLVKGEYFFCRICKILLLFVLTTPQWLFKKWIKMLHYAGSSKVWNEFFGRLRKQIKFLWWRAELKFMCEYCKNLTGILLASLERLVPCTLCMKWTESEKFSILFLFAFWMHWSCNFWLLFNLFLRKCNIRKQL